MQTEFLNLSKHYKKVILPIKQQIISSQKERCPTIFIEYFGLSETISDLTILIENEVAFGKKHGRDGSKKILEIIKENKWKTNLLKVCGIFAEECVLSTVEGLLKKTKTKEINVNHKACYPCDEINKEWQNKFPRNRRLKFEDTI